MYICMYVHVCLYICNAYMYACMYVYMHIYMHIYMHFSDLQFSSTRPRSPPKFGPGLRLWRPGCGSLLRLYTNRLSGSIWSIVCRCRWLLSVSASVPVEPRSPIPPVL